MAVTVATADRDAARLQADAPKKANATNGKVDAETIGVDLLAVNSATGSQPVSANAMVVDAKARAARGAAVVLTGIPSDSNQYLAPNGLA